MEKAYFFFGKNLVAVAGKRANNATILDIWKGFCGHCGMLTLVSGTQNSFLTPGMEALALPDGKEFAIRVTQQGIAVTGRDYAGLVRGLMVLMMRIEPVDLTEGAERFRIAECYLESHYTIGVRMIHLCVFPETSPLLLKRLVRLAGVMQYTHVVLEYWGMLRYDCLKELSWPNAFTKEQVKETVREIQDMGMEAIPMMNHLGHAAGCRVSGGKHVVLDQNPRLACLFSPDGWSWNIENPEARALLQSIRQELYEIYPDTRYIHLGCDEVYSYERGEEDQRRMRQFLHDLIEEVKAEGRQPIIWGDMLLNAQNVGIVGDRERYFCSCDDPEDARRLIEAIPKDTIIADWHYDNRTAPVKTSLYLKEQGFSVIGVPWLMQANCQAHADTIREYGLTGIMVSTWHTLAEKMPNILTSALICGAIQSPWSGPQPNKIRTETAALMRKVGFVNGDYREAGWTEAQVFQQAYPMA